MGHFGRGIDTLPTLLRHLFQSLITFLNSHTHKRKHPLKAVPSNCSTLPTTYNHTCMYMSTITVSNCLLKIKNIFFFQFIVCQELLISLYMYIYVWCNRSLILLECVLHVYPRYATVRVCVCVCVCVCMVGYTDIL